MILISAPLQAVLLMNVNLPLFNPLMILISAPLQAVLLMNVNLP